ncbi:MAG TPA: RNA-guided endonuclease TnpB family protein [Bacteroidia bacterium]|nr:RNA-guided endonuclease TnpB family protein [Bacteroidia bacterium]
MLKAYKYRLYPTQSQAATFDQWIGVCRFVYNLGLETKITAWESAKLRLSAFDLNYQLKELKSFDWVKSVDSKSLQAEMRYLESAYQKFFKGGGFPSFKKRQSNGAGSFSCTGNTRKIDFDKGFLTIPKIKNIPINIDRRFEGKIKTVTISKSSTGKYYASVLVDNGIELPKTKEVIRSTTIGIDVGISNFVVTSEGEVFPNLRSLKSCLDRLKVIQKRASRKVKGSQNKKKANKRVAMLHEKIRNKRIDHIHKTTSALVKTKIHESQVESIVVEDLNVAGMLKNRKLSQALSDVSLSEFMRQLDYKCKWNGINLIKIGRFDPSSKLCSSCQQKNDNLKLSDRLWTCSNCGETHDRDLNAAINVRDIGLSRSGRSEEPVELSALVEAVKQESNSVIVCNVVN